MLYKLTLTTCSLRPPPNSTITQVRYRKLIKKFSVINQISKYEPNKIPEPLFEDMYNYPIEVCPLGVRHPGFWFKKTFYPIKEMEPVLMVPDLTGFKLKPYVSYRTPDIEQAPLTAKDLFNKTYGTDLIRKAMAGEELKFEVDEDEILFAKLKALQPNADLFEPTKQELEEMSP